MESEKVVNAIVNAFVIVMVVGNLGMEMDYEYLQEMGFLNSMEVELEVHIDLIVVVVVVIVFVAEIVVHVDVVAYLEIRLVVEQSNLLE
jgi:hypothetical protein